MRIFAIHPFVHAFLFFSPTPAIDGTSKQTLPILSS